MRRLTIHKEGRKIILFTGIALLALNAAFHTNFILQYLSISTLFIQLMGIFSAIIFCFVVYFFRLPDYDLELIDNKFILAPADGKIVVIEEVNETEYFKDKRMQISIFMSPTNVHVNRTPISGTVKYTKYHPGNYLVAYHPKSSQLNERFTSVIECPETEFEILVRQIAGKVARKISNYLDEGEEVIQGDQMGFIKFGSRVDIFLPLNAEISVSLKEKVKGGQTILAKLP